MLIDYRTNSRGERVRNFDEACGNLLKEILKDAKLVDSENDSNKDITELNAKLESLAVLDLGFGCGDQIIKLVHLTQPTQGWTKNNFRYVGLTLNATQIQAARRTTGRNDSTSALSSENMHLICANAATPEAWTATTRSAVESIGDRNFSENRWLLALDCLYHFSPSRRPTFEYTARKLRANVMAFDLVLNDTASWKETLAVRAVGYFMGCPIKTFLTEEQYRAELVQCGFERDAISMRDISEHVFLPVSSFIQQQDRALSQYGIGLGGFKLAGRLFEWFGRSKVVRAVIVVARAEQKTS